MRQKVDIHIGDIFASERPAVVGTLLGSCVSVCLHDPTTRIGGINHILLPGSPDLVNFNESARYGVNAMELLVNRMLSLGANRRALRAKVFGGGHVLVEVDPGFSPGAGNVDFVLRFLSEEAIPVIGQDTGGRCSRRLLFHTDTFDVFVKRIAMQKMEALAGEEMRFLSQVERALVSSGGATIFEAGRPAPPLGKRAAPAGRR